MDNWRYTLPETNIFAPENGWLEDDPFLLRRLLGSCELLVSGRVTTNHVSSVQNPVDIPLYWLIRDSYHGLLLQSPYDWVV